MYSDLVTGLLERFATVPNLPTRLDHFPDALVKTPAVYTLLDSFKRYTENQVTTMTYRVLCRVLINWQVPSKAEQLVIAFVNTLPAAIEVDPFLGGRTTVPAKITNGEAGFAKIGGDMFRCIDFYAEVSEEGDYAGDI